MGESAQPRVPGYYIELQLDANLPYLRRVEGGASMLQTIVNAVFGCPHRRTTFPLTPARRNGAPGTRHSTYVVCLDCGKEFDYNWEEMRKGHAMPPRPIATATESYSPANR